MIKNNFNILWFVVVGIVVTNIPCMYGAEHFDIITFLNSENVPSENEAELFTNYLDNTNRACEKVTLQSNEECEWLAEILKQENFVNKCQSILDNPQITHPYKKDLAKTYFEIRFNEKINDPAINLPMSSQIKSNLSPVYLLTVEIDEKKPSQWIKYNPYKKAELSIEAISRLGTIIQDHHMEKAEASSYLLTQNFLGYLTHIDSFFKNETNLASKSLIGSTIEKNKNFITTLVKITTNDRIKNTYNSLKNYVPSLPSYEELLPKLVIPQAFPAQPILTPGEIEKIEEKNKSRKQTIFFRKTIDLIELLNKDLNNFADQNNFKSGFETIIYGWENESIDDIKPILKKLFESDKFQSALQKVRGEFSEQFDNRVKIFFEYLSQPISQQQHPTPITPHSSTAEQQQAPHPFTAQAPAIAAAVKFPAPAPFPAPTTYQKQSTQHAPQFGYSQHHNPVQQKIYTSPLSTAATHTPEQIQSQQKEDARLRGKKIQQLNNYIYDISTVYIKDQQDRLQLITNAVSYINRTSAS